MNGWYELPPQVATNYSLLEEASESFCKSVEAGAVARDIGLLMLA